MTQHEPTEPSRLLQDLESIRTLLDEPDAALDQQPDLPLDIPLLQDIISSGSDTPAAAIQANPFLPYESLARLAVELVHLEQLLQQGNTPPSDEGVHTEAREDRM